MDNEAEAEAMTIARNRMRPISPGEVLQEQLDALDLSAAAFARKLHVPTKCITEILNGDRALTPDTALRLEQFFGTSAQFWMNLQAGYDLRIAELRSGWVNKSGWVARQFQARRLHVRKEKGTWIATQGECTGTGQTRAAALADLRLARKKEERRAAKETHADPAATALLPRPRTFMGLALAGMIANPEEAVDDYIDKWHGARTRLSLHEWLGFTPDEYALFVQKPEFLRILLARVAAERRIEERRAAPRKRRTTTDDALAEVHRRRMTREVMLTGDEVANAVGVSPEAMARARRPAAHGRAKAKPAKSRAKAKRRRG